MGGEDSWSPGAGGWWLGLARDSCVLHFYFYRAILMECVAMGTVTSQGWEGCSGGLSCSAVLSHAGHRSGAPGTAAASAAQVPAAPWRADGSGRARDGRKSRFVCLEFQGIRCCAPRSRDLYLDCGSAKVRRSKRNVGALLWWICSPVLLPHPVAGTCLPWWESAPKHQRGWLGPAAASHPAVAATAKRYLAAVAAKPHAWGRARPWGRSHARGLQEEVWGEELRGREGRAV